MAATQKKKIIAPTRPPSTADQLRALAQKLEEDAESGAGADPAGAAALLRVRELLLPLAEAAASEEEAIRESLEEVCDNARDFWGLRELAETAAADHAELEKTKDEVEGERDALLESEGDAADCYHAFATHLGWRYPDGSPMPSWHQVDYDMCGAFEAAIAEAVRRG